MNRTMALEREVRVREAMSSPVVTVGEKTNVEKVAKLMTKRKIGSVIVTSRDGKPIGIVTSRDIVERLVSKNLKPSDINVRDIMSRPLITVDPESKIEEAADLMTRRGIERLAVMDYDKLKLIGMISAADITRIAPMVFDVASERLKLQEADEELKPPLLAGYCEICGGWSELLEELEGKFICNNCKLELYRER